jgi:protocadherin alpha
MNLLCSLHITLFQGYERNSRSCSLHGNLQCGVCDCSADWYGDQCQCQRNSAIPVQLNENACRMNNNSAVCSGFGVCECGVCTCNVRPNPQEVRTEKRRRGKEFKDSLHFRIKQNPSVLIVL